MISLDETTGEHILYILCLQLIEKAEAREKERLKDEARKVYVSPQVLIELWHVTSVIQLKKLMLLVFILVSRHFGYSY